MDPPTNPIKKAEPTSSTILSGQLVGLDDLNNFTVVFPFQFLNKIFKPIKLDINSKLKKLKINLKFYNFDFFKYSDGLKNSRPYF
jgi:hypothetical protein